MADPAVPAADRSALVGTMISGGGGLAWTLWGASGLTGPAAVVVRIAGLVAGLAIMSCAMRRMRSTSGRPSEQGGSMFRSRAYRVITGAEVIGLFGGGAILNATGNSSYAPGWFAIVVGVHFVAFGRFFTPMFGVLGLLLLAGGTAGTVVGLAGGGKHAIAVAGLVAAAGLLVAGVYGLARQRA